MSQGTQHNHPLVVKNYPAETMSAYLSMLKCTCRTCKSYTKCPVRKQMVLPFNLLNNYQKTKQKISTIFLQSIQRKHFIIFPSNEISNLPKCHQDALKKGQNRKNPDCFSNATKLQQQSSSNNICWLSLLFIFSGITKTHSVIFLVLKDHIIHLSIKKNLFCFAFCFC